MAAISFNVVYRLSSMVFRINLPIVGALNEPPLVAGPLSAVINSPYGLMRVWKHFQTLSLRLGLNKSIKLRTLLRTMVLPAISFPRFNKKLKLGPETHRCIVGLLTCFLFKCFTPS